MPTKQTYFQKDWLKKEECKNFLKACNDKKIAFCSKCRTTIELFNIGEQAKRKRWKKNLANSKPVTWFFQLKSVSVAQPVVTGIDGGPSGSSLQRVTVSTNQKQLTLMLQSTDSVEKRKAEIETSPSSLRICAQIVMLQVNFKWVTPN